MENKAKWVYSNGSEITAENQQELVNRLAADWVRTNFAGVKPEPIKSVMSMAEYVFYILIAAAMENAKRSGIKDTRKMAMYVVGYLSAQIPIKGLELKRGKRGK